MTRVLLLSTYDLGRQPFGLASPAAWLRREGVEVTCVDMTRTKLTDEQIQDATFVGVFLPMHTATRMALPVIERVRRVNPHARLCAYGLYAPLNEPLLREHGVDVVLGPEFEESLVAAVTGGGVAASARELPRVRFIQPDRAGLPPLARYASLQAGEQRKTAGYTEATRGCKHRCRHCPIVPVYEGRFRAVPVDVVLADIDAQVRAGAEHITFGDPDFLNGPTHARTIVERLHAAHPDLTYDVTIKVEHLLNHRDMLPILRETGCAFILSAVESMDDRVLAFLEKGHTRADAIEAVRLCREAGVALSPTFVAFTPWTTLETYCAFLQDIDRLDLVPAVAPIQYAIRLLVPEGSRMLELADVRARIERYDPSTLTYIWRHADPRVDALQRQLESLAGAKLTAPRPAFFQQVWDTAYEAAGITPPPRAPLVARAAVPYLNEPWYC